MASVVEELSISSSPGGVRIVSDLHLGNPHFHPEAFRSFLSELPEGAALVVNGDTLDNPSTKLPPAHQENLQALLALHAEDRLFWIPGNHDAGSILPFEARLTVANRLRIDNHTVVMHGDYFDSIMPHCKTFMHLVHLAHRLRIKMGASPVHIAHYAKNWSRLYAVLRGSVRRRAVRFAAEEGLQNVICGHVHYAESTLRDNIRYLNTGSWTEPPLWYAEVTRDNVQLKPFHFSS